MATATLGIVVDTSQAKTAAADLDKITASAGRADTATASMGRSASSAFKQAAQGTNEFTRNVQNATSNVIPFRRAIDDAHNSTRQTANQMRNLSFQLNDIATGLASGQSPFTILAQQGGQVYQALQMGPGGVGGSLRAIGTQLAALVTPARLAVGGLAAIGVAGLVAFQSWKSFTLGIDDAARSAGIAQQEFSKLQAAASFKGISGAEFNAGMAAFAQKLDEARNGAGSLFKLFDANKVAIGDNATALNQFSDLIKNAKSDTERLYYLQLGGVDATMQWVRYLGGGADALEKAKKEAEGFAANKEMIEQARAFDEAWNMAWTNFKANALSAIQGAISGLSSLSSAARSGLVSVFGGSDVGQEMLKRGQGTPLSSDVNSMYGGLFGGQSAPAPLKITVDPRSIKSIKDTSSAVDGLAESMRRLNEQRTTALEKAQRETSELLSFAGASRGAALAQAELAKYRERNITITPQIESEVRAWAAQLAAVQDLNKAIRTIKDTAVDFAQSLVSGLMQGQNLMQSLGSAAKSLGSSLMNSGIQNVMSGNFLTGGIQVVGGFLSNLFGGNQAKKQQQQQQMQQQLQAQQQAAKQAAEQAAQEARQREEQARQEAERRLQAEQELAQRLADLRQASADREFAALLDTSTLAGKLAEYDRKALREREEAQRQFGTVTVELERAQAAERSAILRDAARGIKDYYDGLKNQISDFTRSLQFGNLSTLSPAEQFMASRNDFQSQLALAQGGDRTAQGGITSVAQTLIEQARSYLGPSVEFGNLVERVTAQLNALPSIAMSNDPQVQELQRMGADYFAPMSDNMAGMRAEQKALAQQVVQLQAANNNSTIAVATEIGRLRLDFKQGLAEINLRR